MERVLKKEVSRLGEGFVPFLLGFVSLQKKAFGYEG
jgi:hypothetical protein